MFALSQFSGPDYLGAWNRLMFHKIREIKTGNENDEMMEQNVFRRSRSPTLRVNVSKNQTKIENSWPQSKNRFGSFFVHGKANVLPSVKWSFLKHAFFWNKPLKIILPYLPTLFGLKLGQDFKNRGAPPQQEFPGVPPPGAVWNRFVTNIMRTTRQWEIQNSMFRTPVQCILPTF